MQNNKQPGFKGWMRDKGYYIVLVLCVAAVGISGYLYFNQTASPDSEATQTVSAEQQTPPSAQTTPDKEETAPSADAETSTDDTQSATALQISAPVSGEVIESFAADHLAYNETMQDWRVHNGVDLAAEVGTTVSAAADGTVSAVLEDDFYGTVVEITHAGDYVSRYCNLAQEVSVSVGDTVSAGDAIGTVGQTAKLELAQQPHLHFELCQGESLLNPEQYLPVS